MTAQPADSPLTWSLVVPVKVLARAKSRLAVLAGPHRAELALAMAADTVAAALACPAVDRVIAVTDDAAAARVLAGLGALVTGDDPGRGLNPALRHGAALAAAAGRARASGRSRPTCPRCAPRSLASDCGRRRTSRTLSSPTPQAPGPPCTRSGPARGLSPGSARAPRSSTGPPGRPSSACPGWPACAGTWTGRGICARRPTWAWARAPPRSRRCWPRHPRRPAPTAGPGPGSSPRWPAATRKA